MSKDLPTAIADSDEALDKLLAELEKGEVPSPEVPATATEEAPAAVATIETPVDDSAPKPGEDLAKQLERANQRFKTLEGMMKADRKRSVEIVEKLTGQLEENRVAQIQKPLDVGSILSEEEMAEFGENGVRVLEKLAGAIANNKIEKATLEVEQKLEAMRKRVDQAEASAEGNTTWDLVERINPGAKAINDKDVGWFEFLTQADPISGILFRDLGEAAANVGDTQRLSDLIDQYREYANLAKPVVPVKPAQAPTAPDNDGNNRSTVIEKRIYTQDEIREFYDNMARGVSQGITKNLDAAGLKALEDDIDSAIGDGRVKL